MNMSIKLSRKMRYLKNVWGIWCSLVGVGIFSKIVILLVIPFTGIDAWLLFVILWGVVVGTFAYGGYEIYKTDLPIETKNDRRKNIVVVSILYTVFYFFFWLSIKDFKTEMSFCEALKHIITILLGI